MADIEKIAEKFKHYPELARAFLPGWEVMDVVAFDFGNACGIGFRAPSGRRYAVKLEWVKQIGNAKGKFEYDEEREENVFVGWTEPPEWERHIMNEDQFKEFLRKLKEDQKNEIKKH